MNALDQFYFEQQEPMKSCLLALKDIIIDYNQAFEHRWYYRLPCFMFQNQIFCYLWIEKKTQRAYIAIGKGIKLKHPALRKGSRTFTKIMMIDPKEDIPIETIHEIFDMAMKLYEK